MHDQAFISERGTHRLATRSIGLDLDTGDQSTIPTHTMMTFCTLILGLILAIVLCLDIVPCQDLGRIPHTEVLDMEVPLMVARLTEVQLTEVHHILLPIRGYILQRRILPATPAPLRVVWVVPLGVDSLSQVPHTESLCQLALHMEEDL